MKRSELKFEDAGIFVIRQQQEEEVKITVSENKRGVVMSISFYHGALFKITTKDRMVYARSKDRIYFSEPPKGYRGYKISKKNKHEGSKAVYGITSTKLIHRDMQGQYDLRYDPECELFYIDKMDLIESGNRHAHTNR